MSYFERVQKTNNVGNVSSTGSQSGSVFGSSSSTMTGSIWDGTQSNTKAASEESVNIKTYKVKKGDTLAKIAKANNVSLSALLAANPNIKNANLINIGQKITIPVTETKTAKTEQKEEAKAAEQKKETEAKKTVTTTTYSVKKGDTLAKIAQKNKIELAELIKANPQIKNPNIINIGQKITIPVKEAPQAEKKESFFTKMWNGIKSFFGKLFGKNKTEDKQTVVVNDAPKAETKTETKKQEITEAQREEARRDLAEYSEKRAQEIYDNEIKGTGTYMCAYGVKTILVEQGILDSYETGDAYTLIDKFDNCENLEKVEVSRDEIKNLPAGYIVVWDKGGTPATESSKAFREAGHVLITLDDGKEASDRIRQTRAIHTTDYAVYRPKVFTSAEKQQRAIDARNKFVNNKNGDNQKKYLNAYIEWAKAAISDDSFSKSDLQDLVDRLTSVPANNKSDSVKDLVEKCNDLLPQVKAKLDSK